MLCIGVVVPYTESVTVYRYIDRSHGSGYLSEHGAGLGGGVSGGVVVQGVILQIRVPDDPTGSLWS